MIKEESGRSRYGLQLVVQCLRLCPDASTAASAIMHAKYVGAVTTKLRIIVRATGGIGRAIGARTERTLAIKRRTINTNRAPPILQ